MWIRPSIPSSTPTNIPKLVTLRMTPVMTLPSGYFCFRVSQGLAVVCFRPSETRLRSRSKRSTTTSNAHSSASSVQGGAVPVADRVLAPHSLAIDLMYGAAALPFLRWAEAQGAAARDGLGMLVEQAAEAFWLWRGVRPQTEPVLAALRARLDASAP